MQPNPAFSCLVWLKKHHICVTCETKKKGKLEVFLFDVNRTCLAHSSLLWTVSVRTWEIKLHQRYIFLMIQMFFLFIFHHMCVSLSFLMVVRAPPLPLQQAVGARGWQQECVWSAWKKGSDLRFPVWRWPGAVVLLWGAQDFLHGCFVGKRLKLDPLSQGPCGM